MANSPTSVLTRPRPARGFTLIEMLVVLGIIVVVTGVVFSGESNFNRSFFITNTAYDVALTMRQAQTYGISSQRFSDVQNAGYGIYFSNASPTSYLMFADISKAAAVPSNCPVGVSGTPTEKPGNCLYDKNASQGELVQTFSLGSGFSISKFCIVTATRVTNCYTPAANPTQALTILFSRPNQDAVINTLSTGSPTAAVSACMVVSGNGGESRYVSVSQTGQIAVVSSCP